ncbi:hypothetical protein U1Q18_017203 [Sarracenia purpurea var. burkii]
MLILVLVCYFGWFDDAFYDVLVAASVIVGCWSLMLALATILCAVLWCCLALGGLLGFVVLFLVGHYFILLCYFAVLFVVLLGFGAAFGYWFSCYCWSLLLCCWFATLFSCFVALAAIAIAIMSKVA